MEEPRVIFIEIPTMNKSRSVSPISPSMYREKNTGFFDMLSRRFGRRSHDELYFSHNGEEDTRSSSTESSSSTSAHPLATRNDGSNKPRDQITASNKQRHYIQNCACEFGQNCESHSSSDSSSDSVEQTPNGLHAHRRSTSSIRQAIENLSISTRSLSCSSTGKDQKVKKNKKPSPQPKCILRQPISYTYLKGMSGLPTQRVPKSSVCCHYPTHR
ncbi:uncharacterized protein LOC129579053 [Sitodiplosis mosellana]|uniref:uncharacterized protein LOC129579053 n=1 Tax=Sitodiplosis mosellana TaxID=263140 RepID=UPI0024438846|nr:uncharacterized protein LOC129579053 [Sitodiplosis mosellana]